MRINNSPYVLVKDRDSLELVREGNVLEEAFVRNRAVDFEKLQSRPGFVKAMGKSINEQRFNLNDRFDKSTYLTKVKRASALINFEKPSKRIADLI
mmetsp:Transcript_25793/g.34483  ORF Transcript_25793/g.34483 Transcript_25793/m.34483 type:complete len:96 (+) Transcript_25793:1129-1416(+)|eukprot:CAMPEP_0170450960 /NCGR_PEP_ID=MMETSP0123-20130129/338_1 /TAXON_ID=182087 /ORGANISM="Favella ehrenbergii, Strain Fehren 1" /LENGTH=95 /DNA_ID=CAMNT_0010712447 /DNA_START=1041 /DNA_END=1328 /DNA_ORIENTATION=+